MATTFFSLLPREITAYLLGFLHIRDLDKFQRVYPGVIGPVEAARVSHWKKYRLCMDVITHMIALDVEEWECFYSGSHYIDFGYPVRNGRNRIMLVVYMSSIYYCREFCELSKCFLPGTPRPEMEEIYKLISLYIKWRSIQNEYNIVIHTDVCCG